MSYKHTFSDDIQEGAELNGQQVWRPAIAHPYYVGFGLRKAKCGCGRVFKNVEDFKAHYVYMAVWENESNYIPELLAKEREVGKTLKELELQEKKKVKS